MPKCVLTSTNDIIINDVSFKRSCNSLAKILKQEHAVNIPLAVLHDTVAVSMGFANYHEMRRKAEAEQPKSDVLLPRSRAFFEQSANDRAKWVKPCSPKKLLEKRSLYWIETAIRVTDHMSRIMGQPTMTKPNITLVIGHDSSLVLQTISRVYKEPKYFSIQHGDTLQGVYDDVRGQIAQHQKMIDAHIAEHGTKGYIGGFKARANGVYQCIAGLAEKPIDKDVMHQLTRISELDPSMSLAINIDRADLLKFTAPDLTEPHFHYLTIVDLDKIESQPFSFRSDGSSDYQQSTYSIWVNPKTRHESLFPNLEYRPQQQAG